jgi:hypothetical protein
VIAGEYDDQDWAYSIVGKAVDFPIHSWQGEIWGGTPRAKSDGHSVPKPRKSAETKKSFATSALNLQSQIREKQHLPCRQNEFRYGIPGATDNGPLPTASL